MTAPREDTMYAALHAALPAFVPEWPARELSPGAAFLHVVARHLATLDERLDGAIERHRLAFLDALGFEVATAQPARANVVFDPAPNAATGRVPAGAPVGAPTPGAGPTLVFETEEPLAIAAAPLAEVVSLVPAVDAFADHSAAASAGEPFQIFAGLQPTEHALYLAHDHLALSGRAQVEVEVGLAVPAPVPLEVAWEYWDGAGWRGFGDFAAGDEPGRSFDATLGLTHSGTVRLVAECATSAPTQIAGRTGSWIRARLRGPRPAALPTGVPLVQAMRLRSVLDRSIGPAPAPGALQAGGLLPDAAFANATRLDLTTTVQPLGARPQPGATFAFSAPDAFQRPGTAVTLQLSVVPPQPAADAATQQQVPNVVWEYWNGAVWAPLTVTADRPATSSLLGSGALAVTAPDDGAGSKLHGVEGRWWRARLVTGDYGGTQTITWRDNAGNTNTVQVFHPAPPALANLRIGYVFRSPWAVPHVCVTHDDFAWTAHELPDRGAGQPFPAFNAVRDAGAALYLGFDAPLPADSVGVFVDVDSADPYTGGPGAGDVASASLATGEAVLDAPETVWEYWNGAEWAELSVRDGSGRLTRPGVVRFSGPTDSTALARFGRARHWVRVRTADAAQTPQPRGLRGIRPNAVSVAQQRSIADEALGTSTGEARQSFFLKRTPLLGDVTVEIRELSGATSGSQLPALQSDVAAAGGGEGDIRVVTDAAGRVSEVWVRWAAVRDLRLSAAQARHFVVERTTGRVAFGTSGHGRIPPAGCPVVARSYRSGGGAAGNVAADAISSLLSSTPGVRGVRNPRAAAGGADADGLARASARASAGLRHRFQAVTLADYEALAGQASSAVAVAHALAGVGPDGGVAPGWVTVVVVPHSGAGDPAPRPTPDLCDTVSRYLLARMPAAAGGRVSVTAPRYLLVGAAGTLVVAAGFPASTGQVLDDARSRLGAYLHPVTGGPAGRGWLFGRDVHVSDVASLFEAVPGVDYVTGLHLLLDDAPQPDVVRVPVHRIVAAGPLRLRAEVR